MRITRLYTPVPLIPGTPIQLTAEGANHIAKVLRARVGDRLAVFDGTGTEFSAVIATIAGKTVNVTLEEQIATGTESPLRITLIQGISRGERMDWVMQKATELGVANIAPVVTARSVVKLDSDQAAKKHGHWQSIVIGACEQCGRASLPQLAMPESLPQFLARQANTLRLVLDPEATQSLAAVQPAESVQLLIGPEGGLDDAELTAAKNAGFVPVAVGPRVLRTETAAIAAIALLQGKCGDLR